MAKSTATSKMSKAKTIVTAAYKSDSETPRQVAIANLQKKLGMKKTTAGTYHGLVLKAIREEQNAEALERAEAGKKVWSAVKTNGEGIVTSAGLFTSASAAKTFNADFRHDGVSSELETVGEAVTGKLRFAPKVAKKAA